MAGGRLFASFVICALLGIVSGQMSIDNQKGSEVGKNAGISIAICYGTIFIITGVVNFLRWKFIKRNRPMQIQ